MTVPHLRDELQQTLGDAYTIERELGGGGMSSVFVAHERALGRNVVVKVLPYELAATVSIDRFKREIMLSAALQHPHIVPVLSAGEADGLPFFIMPFVEGESLRTRLDRGPLSVREVVSILKDVSRALAYAHGRGIIHRDIKPDNILLSVGSATVTDFGVAKAISASREGIRSGERRVGTITLAGTSIGTPAYMAPEQAAGDPAIDHRADLYALGIVGYEMLVGTPPFHGRAPQQLLAAQITEPPPPIESRRYDVPVALSKLIMRLLEKDPSKRPRNAAELARALEDPAVVSGTFVSVDSGGSRPRRVLWALAGAGILASVAAGGAWWTNRHAPAPTVASTLVAPAVKSIAVMPLVNIGRDTSDAYFAEGMTAELGNALSRIPGLRVAASTAASAIRAQAATPADIGKALNVTMLLEGTVQRDQGRLRVTARLVNIADGFTLWSDMFERKVTDVFEVQDEIAHAIVEAISPEVTPANSAVASTSHGTADIQAYDLYLRGRFFFRKRGESALRHALDYFQQAVKRDPTFARAYAGIADVYGLLPIYSPVRIDSVMPLALHAIDRAIALDSMLPEAFASRANLLQANWKWKRAEGDYKRALALDANNAMAHQWYGEMLLLNGRVDDARDHLKRAADLDPLSSITHGSYALSLAVGRTSGPALTAGRRALELDSNSVISRFMFASVQLQAARTEEAIGNLEIARRLDPANVQTLSLLGYAYARAGRTEQARELATQLADVAIHPNGAAAAARIHLGLGEVQRALDLLERAASAHDSFFSSESLSGFFFDPLRGNSRFAAVVKTVGLDQRVAR